MCSLATCSLLVGVLFGGAPETVVRFVPTAGKSPTYVPVLGVDASPQGWSHHCLRTTHLGVNFAPLLASGGATHQAACQGRAGAGRRTCVWVAGFHATLLDRGSGLSRCLFRPSRCPSGQFLLDSLQTTLLLKGVSLEPLSLKARPLSPLWSAKKASPRDPTRPREQLGGWGRVCRLTLPDT